MGLTRIPLATLEWRDQWGTSPGIQAMMKQERERQTIAWDRIRRRFATRLDLQDRYIRPEEVIWLGGGPGFPTPLWFWFP